MSEVLVHETNNSNGAITVLPEAAPAPAEYRQRSALRRKIGVIGAGLAMAATLSGASCNPDPVTCELSSQAEGCWDLNTGVLRGGEGNPERWTTAEILSGEAGLDHIVGDVTITQSGTVLENKWIDGCIEIAGFANDVEIRNSLVRSDHNCPGGTYGDHAAIISTGYHQDRPNGTDVKNLLVANSIIIGLPSGEDTAAIGQTEYTIWGSDISGVVKGARGDYNVNINNNYAHDLEASAYHGEFFFMGGGPGDLVGGGPANVTVSNNWARAQSEGANSGAVALLNDYDGSGVSVTHNYLDGNGNGVGFRGGAYTNKPGEFFYNVTFKDNVVQTNNAGQWTVDEVNAWCDTCPGMVWENNVDENGNVYPEPTPING